MQQRHIINRQILEVKLPKTADTFAVQKEFSTISREQLMPIIDKILSKCFDGTEGENVQLDRLVIDLGTLKQEDFISVFAEKLNDVLIEKQTSISTTKADEKRSQSRKSEQKSHYSKRIPSHEKSEVTNTGEFRKTPLKIFAHYLSSGILPWWAAENTKSFLYEQLDNLLENPDSSFIKLIAQLRFNTTYLERFVYTFSENQVLRSLQLLTSVNLQVLIDAQNDVNAMIEQKNGQLPAGISKNAVKTIFWKSAFHQLAIATDVKSLKNQCVIQTLSELAIDQSGSAINNKQLRSIQSLVKKCSTQYLKDHSWQEFFKNAVRIVNSSAFNRVNPRMLAECKRLLLTVELKRENSGEETESEVILRPFAEHLQTIQKSIGSLKEDAEPFIIEQLTSSFEETDFISVHNSGLILFWPFLVRFFQNLGLVESKGFKDEFARNKAICALQYLSGEEDTEMFEGQFSLNKLMCGTPLEDVVEPISLSQDEKEMVEDLLQVVIQRGPNWGNLSVAGFRSSYLLREGSLRMRDGHWLLQVKKETHDITMERLPWSIGTVKLPWMDNIILVEWM